MFFVLAAVVQASLVDLGIVHIPYLYSWAYLAILVAMVSELNTDLLTAAHVAADLKESERRIELASIAANLGLWTWDIAHNTIWATPRARTLFGLSESETLDQEKFTNAVHPEDRELRRRAIKSALAIDKEYEVDYACHSPMIRFAGLHRAGGSNGMQPGSPCSCVAWCSTFPRDDVSNWACTTCKRSSCTRAVSRCWDSSHRRSPMS